MPESHHLPPLDIEDDRTFETKLRNGDAGPCEKQEQRQVMTRQELLNRLEPIISRIISSVDDISSLTTSPEFDEDYKVARAHQLSTKNLDRLHLAAVELSIATEALLVSP